MKKTKKEIREEFFKNAVDEKKVHKICLEVTDLLDKSGLNIIEIDFALDSLRKASKAALEQIIEELKASKK